MSKFDLIIPIAPNDFGALAQSISYVKNHIKCGKIVIIASIALRDKVQRLQDVEFLDEDMLIDGMSLPGIKKIIARINPKASRRAGWYFQQFLKMGYAQHCNAEYYMTWDSDTFPIKDVAFFRDGKPILSYIKKHSYDDDYSKVITELFDDISYGEISVSRSYITEHMMFSTSIMNELIEKLSSETPFYETIIKSINPKLLNLSGFSEFETYAAYVHHYHPDTYIEEEWKNLRNGNFYLPVHKLEEYKEWVGQDFDVVSFEDYDTHFCLNKLFLDKLHIHRIMPFSVWVSFIQPLYNKYYNVRMSVRKIIRR